MLLTCQTRQYPGAPTSEVYTNFQDADTSIKVWIWNLNYEGTNDKVWWELFSKKYYRGTVFYDNDIFFLTAKLGTSLRVWDLGQNVEYNMIIMCLVIILLLQKLPCLCMTEPCYDASVADALCIECIRKYLAHDSKSPPPNAILYLPAVYRMTPA